MDSINFILDGRQKILSYPDNQNIGDEIEKLVDRKNHMKPL